MRGRATAIVLFASIHVVPGVVVFPGLIVILDIGVADPATAGWPTALLVAILALWMTATHTCGFAVGLTRSLRRSARVKRGLYRLSMLFGVVALAGSVVDFWLMESLADSLRYGYGFSKWSPFLVASAPAMVLPAVLGYVAGRKCERVTGFCMHCDYDLTGNVSGVCPECGTSIDENAAP